jgi:hypothetical protein
MLARATVDKFMMLHTHKFQQPREHKMTDQIKRQPAQGFDQPELTKAERHASLIESRVVRAMAPTKAPWPPAKRRARNAS